MYHEIVQAVGHILNLIFGLIVAAGVIVFVGSLAMELHGRPRFSLRTILIAMTVFAVLFGMASISHR
jgi:hypothetical protein